MSSTSESTSQSLSYSSSSKSSSISQNHYISTEEFVHNFDSESFKKVIHQDIKKAKKNKEKHRYPPSPPEGRNCAHEDLIDLRVHNSHQEIAKKHYKHVKKAGSKFEKSIKNYERNLDNSVKKLRKIFESDKEELLENFSSKHEGKLHELNTNEISDSDFIDLLTDLEQYLKAKHKKVAKEKIEPAGGADAEQRDKEETRYEKEKKAKKAELKQISKLLKKIDDIFNGIDKKIDAIFDAEVSYKDALGIYISESRPDIRSSILNNELSSEQSSYYSYSP